MMKLVNCKICSNRTTAVSGKTFSSTYYFCAYCRFIFIDEDNIVAPGKEVDLYKQHNNTFANEGYVNMFNVFMRKTVEPYEDKIDKALDFGCGPGPVLAGLLQQKGFTVDIYDPYFAPERTFEKKSYDLITSTEVFEHLKNPLETLSMLKNHLTKDGILAIMTLFHPDDTNLFKQWWYRRDPTHIAFYRPFTFNVLARLAGGLEVTAFDHKNICVLRKMS